MLGIYSNYLFFFWFLTFFSKYRKVYISIWVEFDEGGKSDFICTNAQTFYIRDGILMMVSQMRSNDAIFGYKNDYAWAQYLMDKFVTQWNEQCKLPGNKHFTIDKGMLTWQVMNLHVYERHFHLVV